MAKLKKRGTSGQAKNFITRTQAVRRLQISLPDFRRLCIFKGIYPREPRNKKKANKGSTAPTTFYYTRDIQYLLHEPVLGKFREHKAFTKKLSKALGRGELNDAKRLEAGRPKITLDHLVKERYPTFVDALRDLDDALSTLFLFSNLPLNTNLPKETVETCQRLCNEWQHYIIRSGALRKSFLSIKGIYYSAEIQGQDILWLVPYKFAQNVPVEVDFRVMHTFVEFYTTLLGFVMFRLYTNLGLVYPPRFDVEADHKGAGLSAFKIENRGIGKAEAATNGGIAYNGTENAKLVEAAVAAATIGSDEKEDMVVDEPPSGDLRLADDSIDSFAPISSATAVDILPQPSATTESAIFLPFTFFLSRETPREPLEFLLRSFGCKRIGWDSILGDGSFTTDSSDKSISHQVVDRPPAVGLPPQAGEPEIVGRVPGRVYVQPQWVWDCVNKGELLSPSDYAPGAMLPPHLSPWIKVSPGGYDPTALIASGDGVSDNDAGDYSDVDMDNGMIEDLGTDDDKPVAGLAEPENNAEESSEDEEEIARKAYQRELEAEARGETMNVTNKEKKRRKKSRKEREEEERKEMQKIMMPKKKRKLYEKMVYGNQKRQDETENLREKRRKLEQEKKGKV